MDNIRFHDIMLKNEILSISIILMYVYSKQPIMRGCLILLCIFARISYQQCSMHSVYSFDSTMCSCVQGYIGKQCNTEAYQLDEEQKKIPLSNNFTFSYFNSNQQEMFRFILQFCLEDKTIPLHLILQAQQQQQDGNIKLDSLDKKDQLEILMDSNKPCVKIYSSVFLSASRKLDGTLPKIIFGFKQGQLTQYQENRSILVKCQVDYYLSTNFMIVLIVIFLVVVFFGIILSTVCLFRQRMLMRRGRVTPSKRRKQIINNIMPTKKYQKIIEESTQSNLQQSCSICLCQFEKSQKIRKTPCGHIYHEDCLDNWCQAHLNCPICRKSFENESEMKDFSYLYRRARRNANLRQVIL